MEVIKIVFAVKDEELELTLGEARELQRLLNNVLGWTYTYPQWSYTTQPQDFGTITVTSDNTKE